ncbi:hypothetical protein L873DRAFT_1823697 [Choiromyces venosus 120613-1]|uniref:Uncharacterized protein n=1 Tax=Choiromyces venosus 120613-1 TaxID=1336337 RepID=A0A3N4J522_9PEZI|nr:hypothetical protein L873DRAFT_1823697 [Choiromyces venosus 120613-1]
MLGYIMFLLSLILRSSLHLECYPRYLTTHDTPITCWNFDSILIYYHYWLLTVRLQGVAMIL